MAEQRGRAGHDHAECIERRIAQHLVDRPDRLGQRPRDACQPRDEKDADGRDHAHRQDDQRHRGAIALHPSIDPGEDRVPLVGTKEPEGDRSKGEQIDKEPEMPPAKLRQRRHHRAERMPADAGAHQRSEQEQSEAHGNADLEAPARQPGIGAMLADREQAEQPGDCEEGAHPEIGGCLGDQHEHGPIDLLHGGGMQEYPRQHQQRAPIVQAGNPLASQTRPPVQLRMQSTGSWLDQIA